MTQSNYKEIAAKKLQQRNSTFKKEWLVPEDQLPPPEVKDVTKFIVESGFLSKDEIEITESDAIKILDKIKSKEWTALSVASAFGHRATIAHQLVNCLSEIFFDEGLEMAKELDEYYKTTGKLKGPLHGLPVSLKDNHNIKGHATTIGWVGFAFNPTKMEKDAEVVAMLREAGVVFYVKTNVPVAMMMPESTNHIYGNTVNPLNRDLTAGGSSGGEAALIALKGAPVGIGSDIGGSLRIPSAFQNVFTLRPTSGRFPTYGLRPSLPGQESVMSVIGPIATSLDTLELYTKTVIDAKPWLRDPKALAIPWTKVELPDTLSFAVCLDDGIVKPTPPVLRAMKTVVSKLQEEGHDIIEWDPVDHGEFDELIKKLFLADGGKHVLDAANLSGEPLFPYMEMYGTCKEMGVAELWDLQAERTILTKKYLDRWNKTASETKSGKPIDGIIIPVSPYATARVDTFKYIGYTGVYNVTDYPAGTIPVTRADKSIDLKEQGYVGRNEKDQANYDDYDPEINHGGAISVQIVGRKLEDEKVVEMMKVVSKAIGTYNYWS